MKITDKMLYRHAAEARDIWLGTLPGDSEIPEHQFSEEFNTEIDKLIAQSHHRKKPFKGVQRVAAVFAAAMIGVTSWLAVDVEARATFMQWIRNMSEDSIVYRFLGETPDSDIPNYHCTWLPEGMEAEELVHLGLQGYVIYSGENDLFGSLGYNYMHDGTAHIISPSGEDGLRHETVEINGMPGDFYIESEDDMGHMLVWFDEEAGISFDIHGNMSPEDILRMAESVEEGAVLELMPEYECTWLPKGYSEGKDAVHGSHSRQINSLTDEKDLRLEYEIYDAATLEEHFRIKSETPGIPVTVWGTDAVFYLNTHHDENSLLWLDEEAGIAFRLNASEDQETMLAIAEAVMRK